MFMSLFGFIGATGLLVNFTATPGYAQEVKSKGYLPRLADLMNEAMQVHHTKLWVAAHAENWALATYELKKIRETVEEVKETIVDIQVASSQWQRVPVGEMLKDVDSNLNALDTAAKAKNLAKFETAYNGLTAACNACHVRAGQSQIKIMAPLPNGTGSFSDQDFTASSSQQ